MGSPRERTVGRRALWLAVGVGLALRALAAVVVDRLARSRGTLCLFPDATIYWELASAILRGGPYRVLQWGVPHDALRTPGFPLFLAACRAAFGDATLAPRLAQAALGAWGVWLVARLTARVAPEAGPRAPAIAAGLAAIDPFSVGFSALLLSEAAFVPPMLLTLLGLARLWAGPAGWTALATGAAAGAAILVKPSFALFVPAALAALVATSRRGGRASALRSSAVVLLGLALTMAPWWARNARVFGRFVPTALWSGASLYDGLNPTATGASDMRFLDDPEIRALGEVEQDEALTRRALAFARAEPGRALRLAAIKAGRYWSPWLRAEEARSPALTAITTAWSLAAFGLIAAGLWSRRRDPRAWALLAGPLLYFAAVHMVFVGSVRYRVPAMVPALGLAAHIRG